MNRLPQPVEGLDADRLRLLLEERARARGASKPFWNRIHAFATVSSTQDVLARMESEGAPEGTVVAAAEQTAGRGRLGRRWHSPAGLGLYLSALLRPARSRAHRGTPPLSAEISCMTADAGSIVRTSFAASIAACETLRETGGVDCQIKWPNDLHVGGLKIGGLLVESRVIGERLRAVVLGFGLNVRHGPEEFPDELACRSTSLAIATGRPPCEQTVLAAALLDRLEEWYGRAREDGTTALLRRWRELSPSSVGRSVLVHERDRAWEGVTAGVDYDGALRVRDGGGEERRLRQGEEVRVREVA